jgi:hypothetical protein
MAFTFPYSAALNSGSRAFEAFVRPSPIAVAGTPTSYWFDMRSCTFSLSMMPFQDEPPEDAPTEIFVPEYLSLKGVLKISVSSGRWIMYRSGQVLLWWHSGLKEQTLGVTIAYKPEGGVGLLDDEIERWHRSSRKCQIM